jgi:inorganic pyrophosphatase
MYGISIAALGMISNLAICLTIDAYGPISDNAGGISEMSKLDKGIRDITDALDSAGNTTAAIGKGFAIGSACLVAIALFGAFVFRTKILKVNILEEIVISSIIFGAMIPYIFSAMTMRSVGDAAFEMVYFI